MVEIITFIIDLLIIAGVVFAVLFIRKRLSTQGENICL